MPNTKRRSSIRALFQAGLAGFVLAVAGSAQALVSPISVTGWNYDIVINPSKPYNLTVNATQDGGFGSVESNTWNEAGVYTDANGNNQNVAGLIAGTHASLTGNGTFAFQPFDQNNVVSLNGGDSGTLTLTTPASYSAIALYGASSFGNKTATVTLNFADASSTIYNIADGTGIGTDWFNANTDQAFEAGVRLSNRSQEGYTRVNIDSRVFSINESYLQVSPADQAKLLTSIMITNTEGDRMSVFAVSGQVAGSLIPGDTDGDGDVDVSDLQQSIMNYTGPGGAGQTSARGDTDFDGDIDNSDLSNSLNNFTGATQAAPASVPEPASVVLLGAGVLCTLRRRRV